MKSPQISANASSFFVALAACAGAAPLDPHTSCVSNRPPPPPLLCVGAAGVDHGLLPAPVVVGLVEEPRSSPPKVELSAPIPPEGAAEENDPKSPNAPLACAAGGWEEAEGGGEEKSDMMSFFPLAPPVVAVGEVVVELVGAGSCQSRSKIPPPAEVGAFGAAAGAAGLASVFAAAAGAGAGEGSSRRSIAFAAVAFGTATGAAAAALPLATAAGAAPPSSVEGSLGSGPSLAHLLDSYLLLIKLSIL